jgi:hypothetical protein
MIIVDKNLRTPRVIKAISTWYRGKVIPVISCPVGTTLRPNTIVKDDAIPALLQGANRPTFVTINVTDFWGRVPPHAGYCIIAIVLPQERAREVPDWLRGLFALPEFKTKAVTLSPIYGALGRCYLVRDLPTGPLSWGGVLFR